MDNQKEKAKARVISILPFTRKILVCINVYPVIWKNILPEKG